MGFLLAAGAATAVAGSSTAITAYGRVASYLVVGVAAGRALKPGDRTRLVRMFVGAEAGQALGALTGLTSTVQTDFPIGRYVGTLGDPAQFGIPIAFACVLLVASPSLVRAGYARYGLALLLCAAVAGSATRSAWAVLGTGLLLVILIRLGRPRGTTTRLIIALGGLTVAALATASVILGSTALGLGRESAAIRSQSIAAGWNYLREHPKKPVGLGTGVRVPDKSTVREHLLFASSFEHDTAGWKGLHAATVHRDSHASVFGRSSLRVETNGRERNAGTQLFLIGPIHSGSRYTFSVSVRIPIRTTLLFYVDEYDANTRWIAYRDKPTAGLGTWQRYSWTWKTEPGTTYAVLSILTASKMRTTFLIDGVQLESGATATAFSRDKKAEPAIVRVSAIYDTWLAVAIQLGLASALLLAVLAVGAPFHAYRLGDHATALALAGLLVPSATEDFVFGQSFVTLIWFAAIGLAVTATDSRLGRRQIRENTHSLDLRDA